MSFENRLESIDFIFLFDFKKWNSREDRLNSNNEIRFEI